jgi:hypothetical protein
MTIHKGNIEAYLLDYLEGNLDALLTAKLMAFLSENPEYEKWIPEYDGHICLETGPVFESKQFLKKDFKDVPLINGHNFDEFCIASEEGLLEEKDRTRLDEYLALNPEKQRVFDVYGKLILQPDYLLVYPDKKGLKKRELLVTPFRLIYYAIGVAASIALLFLLVSRKPAEQVLSGNIPDKSTVDPKQKDNTVDENQMPAFSSEDVITPVPLKDPIKKEPASLTEVIISREKNPDIQPLASIEPIKIEGIHQDITGPGIQRTAQRTETPVNYPESNEMADATAKTPASILGSLVKKLNLWKAAETAVTGFNYLTESRLSLVRTTDEKGKFSSLTLESEDYTISGNKVK